MARPLSLLLSLSIGMWITRDGISELQFSNVAKGIQLGRCKRCVAKREGISRKKGVPTGSARSRSDGIGTVGTDEAAGAGVAAVGGTGRGRKTRGGVLARLADGRGAPPGAKPSTAGDAVPAAVDVRWRVLVEMRSEDGFTVGGAGEPGEAGTDAVGPVVSTESVPCLGLLEGVSWATAVAAAGASAEVVLTSVGTAKTEAKSLSAAGKARPQPGQRSTVVTDAETRATNLPAGAERSSILICGRVCENRNKRRR